MLCMNMLSDCFSFEILFLFLSATTKMLICFLYNSNNVFYTLGIITKGLRSATNQIF